MAQQQIKGATGSLGSGGSLDVYDVPGSVIVTPYSVSATFDGSGAGGAFLPCLTFKTQTGAVIARCPAPEVASGDTAEVSWFPHVAQAAAAPAPSGSGWTLATLSAAHIVTVASGASVIVDMASSGLYTNDSSVFAIGSWLHSAVTYHGIKVLADGHYLAKGQVEIGGTQSATSGFVSVTWFNEPGSPASYGSAGAFLNCPTAVAQGQWNPYIENLTTVSGGSTDIWIMQVHNTTNVSVTAYIDMMAVQLDTDTTHIF